MGTRHFRERTLPAVDELAVRGTPEECAAEILRRFGDVAQRVCVYFPGYEFPDADIHALAAALQAG